MKNKVGFDAVFGNSTSLKKLQLLKKTCQVRSKSMYSSTPNPLWLRIASLGAIFTIENSLKQFFCDVRSVLTLYRPFGSFVGDGIFEVRSLKKQPKLRS